MTTGVALSQFDWKIADLDTGSMKPKRPRDTNQLAKMVVDLTTRKSKAPVEVIPIKSRKNPAAVALGRKGGLKSARARMEKIPESERRRIASAAARARWAKEKGDDD